MRILVAVKQVVSLDEDHTLDGPVLQLDLSNSERELNNWDSYALEAGMRLAEQRDDAEVIVATVGSQNADDVLVQCLAKGAARAIRVEPHELLDDPFAVASRLAALARREDVDLVLCGVQASDTGRAATGPATAAALGASVCAVVRGLSWSETGLELERELEGGLRERIQLPLPAVVTVQTGSNQPRYANLRAIKQARAQPIEVVIDAELGVTEPSRRAAAVRALRPRVQGHRAQMLSGDVTDSADHVAELIRSATGS
jgi:electron transfer flavoprotein beta subunit